MPPTQRHPARADEYPAAVAEGAAGGVVGNGTDAGLGEDGTALTDVYPAAVAGGGVADDLPCAQRQGAREDEHPTAGAKGAGGNVAADDGVDEDEICIIVIDTAAVAGNGTADDSYPRDDHWSRAGVDLEDPINAIGVNDRQTRANPGDRQGVASGDVQVAVIGITGPAGQRQVVGAGPQGDRVGLAIAVGRDNGLPQRTVADVTSAIVVAKLRGAKVSRMGNRQQTGAQEPQESHG